MFQAGTLIGEGTKQAWTGIPDIDNAINMLDRIDTLESCDDDRIEAVKTVLRRLAGNSPVMPESCSAKFGNFQHYWHSKGYVIVPKEPTEAMCDISHIGVDVYCGITDDNEYYSIGGAEAAKVWKAMLAAVPQPQNAPQNIPEIIPGWIPVSERMPEDEQEVLTINRMGHRFVSFFDKHSGLFFDRLDAPAACCIEHVLVTHWMPLPAGPQEVCDA
ncbi:TPA: DUF551 domain-containing protein [Klebsiella aerogenes]